MMVVTWPKAPLTAPCTTGTPACLGRGDQVPPGRQGIQGVQQHLHPGQ